jgi:hypothetical protein
MKLPRFDFTSLRDPKGYEIKGVTSPPQQERSFKNIEYEFFRTIMRGAESGRLGKPDAEGRIRGPWISGRIVGKGGKMEMKQVHLSQWPRAFEEFANVKTPNELLAFVTKHGPLYLRQQNVLALLFEAMEMRECMRGGTTEPYSRGLSARLYKDQETGEFEISMTPSCLLDTLWLQFYHSQSSGADFRTCPYCHVTFATGGNSGRLRNAEFCSPEHRKRYNSLARSNPKMRKMRERRR